MKNILLIVLVLAVLGAGAYFVSRSKNLLPKSPSETAVKPGIKKENVFTSIQDALSKSLSLKCVYQDDQGLKTTSYIKAGSVRVTMESTKDKSQPNNIIIKDKKMYMWSDADKTGFIISVKDESLTPGPSISLSQPKNESVLAQIEKYKNSCQPATVADSLFQIPTDVKFNDMDAFGQNLKKNLPIQTVPTGE